MMHSGQTMSLTCYIGIACLQYQGIDPFTLHKCAGLEDGRRNNKSKRTSVSLNPK